jgi:UDP-N-acetylglucosamine--N-acetylmuramyl-(pentapeptide) pyrophosphoryl-undecaprenol N-acetylglucosamine transferase
MTSVSPKKLMIMAAGTGGHIFPGLAIAELMQQRGWEVSWLGTMTGMECQIVPKHHIPMDSLDFTGLRGKGWKHSVTGAFKLIASFFIAHVFSVSVVLMLCLAWAAM